jgi:hypothetical protein
VSTIIDFSTSRPTISQLKTANVTSVGRYIGWDGVSGYPNTGKNLTKAEAAIYAASGISMFLAFEYYANAPALGAEQGRNDGELATEQLTQINAPTTAGVYFAVDYDIPDYEPGTPNDPAHARAKLGPIGDYFAAIKALKPLYRIGVYGGYWAVKRLFDAGLVTLGWQTVAWSGGNVDSRISLLQTTAKSPISYADINVHESKNADWGQWPEPTKPPAPGFIVVPDVRKMDAYLATVALEKAGLHPHGNPLPVVTTQSPAPGTHVAAGTTVSLTYNQ